MRRGAFLLALLATSLVLASCGNGERTSSTVRATRTCATRVEGKLPPTWRRSSAFAGPIAFYAVSELPSPVAGSRNPGRIYAEKVLALVEAASDVTVTVDKPSRRRVRLLYDLSRLDYPPDLSDGTTSARLVACKRTQPSLVGRGTVGHYTQFNGGFVVRWPACARLAVTERGSGRSFHVTFPFGSTGCRSRPSSYRRPRPGAKRPTRRV